MARQMDHLRNLRIAVIVLGILSLVLAIFGSLYNAGRYGGSVVIAGPIAGLSLFSALTSGFALYRHSSDGSKAHYLPMVFDFCLFAAFWIMIAVSAFNRWTTFLSEWTVVAADALQALHLTMAILEERRLQPKKLDLEHEAQDLSS